MSLQMKFPERVLKVRAESKLDFERWYNAIKQAHSAKLEGLNTPQAKQLDNYARVRVQAIDTMSASRCSVVSCSHMC